MKKLALSFIEFILKPFYGKKGCQSFFNTLYFISLRGMNYRNDDMDNNGEVFVLKKTAEYFRDKKNLVLFDVGANVGKYSKRVINNFPSHHFNLYSFEPVKATFGELKNNLAGLAGNKVHLFNFGLGSENKQLPIYSDHASSPLASLYKRDLDHVNVSMEKQAETVEIKTLTAFCDEQRIQHIHFLKLDAEGSEYDIILSAKPMIENKAIDFIQFEFGTTCMENRTYFKNLYNALSNDYHIYRLLKNGLYHYPVYHTDEEVLSLATYLAVSKSIQGFVQ